MIPMRGEIGGIEQAVPADVRTVGIGGIGPPVVAFGIKVVRPPGAAIATRRRDRYRLLFHVAGGLGQDSGAFDHGEVEIVGGGKGFGYGIFPVPRFQNRFVVFVEDDGPNLAVGEVLGQRRVFAGGSVMGENDFGSVEVGAVIDPCVVNRMTP